MSYSNSIEVIAIIPARGGSKGIPKKNITDLCGKPLIAYSIQAALKAKLIDRVIVSTDNDEIADISKTWGAEVPFLRPPELSGDKSNLADAISYTINKLGGPSEDKAFVQLYPTSPFRTPDFIDDMLRILFTGYTSVITVKKIILEPLFLLIPAKDGYELINIFGKNGCAKSWKTFFRQYASFQAYMHQKNERHYYHVLTDKCMLIDIDTPKDLKWAEAIIKNRLFDFMG